MNPNELSELFEGLTTPHVADACLRLKIGIRCAPFDLQGVDPTRSRVAGRVSPVRHYGSVDVFLEALERSQPGDVLVIDNGGRRDEACIGDLIAMEAKLAAIAGVVVWGLHRDTAELLAIGLPLFSLGAIPTGPVRLDAQESDAFVSARVERWTITSEDAVIADENGVVFIPLARAEEIATAARTVREIELGQAARMKDGVSLRAQLQFSTYLTQRAKNPSLTFRQHLRRIQGAVEE